MITVPQTFNVATYFVDRNVLEGRGPRIAIECGDQQVSYQQLLQKTNQVGNALRDLDVRPEERVVVLLEDIPEFIYCFFGTIKIGAVAVPINTFLNARDYEYLLNDARARVAFVSGAILPQLRLIPRSRLRYLQKIAVVGQADAGCLGFSELVANSSPELDAAPTSKDDVAFWLYSSGSTGFPKGCVHLHHDMVVCSELYAKGILRMNEQDRCYSVARLFFAYGLGNAAIFRWQPAPPAYFRRTAQLLKAFTPTSNAIAQPFFSRFPRTMQRCWPITERMEPSLIFPVCATPSPPVKPSLLVCLSVSSSDSTWRFSMLSARPKLYKWSYPTAPEL